MRSLVIWDRTVLHAQVILTPFTRRIVGTHLSTRKDERLSWPVWLVILRWFTRPQTITHPSTHRARRRATALRLRHTALQLSHASTLTSQNDCHHTSRHALVLLLLSAAVSLSSYGRCLSATARPEVAMAMTSSVEGTVGRCSWNLSHDWPDVWHWYQLFDIRKSRDTVDICASTGNAFNSVTSVERFRQLFDEWLIAFCYLYLHCCYTRRNLITLSTGLPLYKHDKTSFDPSSSSRDHKQGPIDVWTDWWKIRKHMTIFSIRRILLSAIGEGEGQESRAVAGKPLDAACYFGQLFLGYFIAHAHECQLFHFRHKIWCHYNAFSDQYSRHIDGATFAR